MKGLTVFLLLLLVHPNHVSVTDIVYNDRTGRLEITTQLFAEDVENIVRKLKDPEFILDEETIKGMPTEIMSGYLANNFKLSAADSAIHLRFIGMEIQDEMVHCYSESAPIKMPEVLGVRNTVLFDLQDEQVNINHYKAGGQTRSARTTVTLPFTKLKRAER